jgi:hypothetical protein
MAQRFDAGGLKLRGEAYSLTDPVRVIPQIGLMFATLSRGTLAYAGFEPTQFKWLDRSGQAAGTFGEAGNYTSFALSLDGRRVVASRASSSGADLWLVDAERNVSSRFTFEPGLNVYPIWSPDGQSIVFRSGIPWNLYRKDSNGVERQERITRSPNPQWPDDWSRNGRFLLMEEFTAATRDDLWVLPVTSDGRLEPGVEPRLYLPARRSMNATAGFPRSLTHAGWLIRRMRVAVTRSTFSPFPSRKGNGKYQWAAAIFPSGAREGRNFSTLRRTAN